MNTHTMCVRVSATLFISLFSSIAFADISLVPDRASLEKTDTIDWLSADDGQGDFTWFVAPSEVTSAEGAVLVVTQKASANSLIIREVSQWFKDSNLPFDEYLLFAGGEDNDSNPFSFSYKDGQGFCGLGTQIAPYDTGAFTAKIEAFNADGDSIDFVTVGGSSTDDAAAFIGISSTEAMSLVEVSISGTAGSLASRYAINHVDLKACDTGPIVPHLSCEGFAAPMANYPVKTKKNRVFPLQMELFNEGGLEQTDNDLTALPVVEVIIYTGQDGDVPIDVSDDALPTGHGSDGNQFDFTDDDTWQFNLKSKEYTAPGEYFVTVISGDETEYIIDPACTTSFIVK